MNFWLPERVILDEALWPSDAMAAAVRHDARLSDSGLSGEFMILQPWGVWMRLSCLETLRPTPIIRLEDGEVS